MGDGKIDRLNTLMELVKLASSTGKGKPAERTALPETVREAGSQVLPQAIGHDMDRLRGRLRSQLKADAGHASRLIVREILLWEFGPQFEQHAEFSSMLTKVEQAFDANPALKAKMASLVEELSSPQSG